MYNWGGIIQHAGDLELLPIPIIFDTSPRISNGGEIMVFGSNFTNNTSCLIEENLILSTIIINNTNLLCTLPEISVVTKLFISETYGYKNYVNIQPQRITMNSTDASYIWDPDHGMITIFGSGNWIIFYEVI